MKKISKLPTIMLYILIIALILSSWLLYEFSQKIEPGLTKYAISEVKRISTLVINDSINKDMTNMDLTNIFDVEKNSNNEIVTLDLNTNNINKILNSVNKTIQSNLKKIESGKINDLDNYFKDFSDIDYEEIKEGIVYYIPTGNFSGNILTNNIGPKIPIKFSMTGDVISSIDSSIKEYGINNAMIEVKIKVKVTMQINMPFVSKETTVKTSVPIVMKIIQGTIPDYYLKNDSLNK